MTIVLTGGGSGGHITPILAVARELKLQAPATRIIYIGQTGDGLGDIPASDPNIDRVYTVAAGKFRRYHSEGLKQLLDLRTAALNIRDVFRIIKGCFQSYWLLGRLKPNAVFIKGGFVGVPVGLAAAARHIPYVTHDSDAVPGLANRIIGRWAKLHALGMPERFYHYPAAKMRYTGIPLQAAYANFDASARTQYRRLLSLPERSLMVFVTGGGLGARRLNRAVLDCLPQLLAEHPTVHVYLQPGRLNEADVQKQCAEIIGDGASRVVVAQGFIEDMWTYYGAADIVITRAGATNIAECAAMGKPTILVPNPFLTGGHQLKNASLLLEADAVRVVDESTLSKDHQALYQTLDELLTNPQMRKQLSENIHNIARMDAAHTVAMLLLT